MRAGIAVFLVALGLTSASPTWAESITGRVVGVHDGDTVTLQTSAKETVKIRLAQIDAPEIKQPYGQDSKKALSDAVFDHEVTVEIVSIDKYGRTVGNVFIGSTDANRLMVQQGAAWAYRKYLTDPSLLDIEAEAAKSKRGLWALQGDQRVPPWEWRKANRIGKKVLRRESVPSMALSQLLTDSCQPAQVQRLTQSPRHASQFV